MVDTITVPKSAALVMNNITSEATVSRLQIPATTPSLNAAYTTSRIDPRST